MQKKAKLQLAEKFQQPLIRKRFGTLLFDVGLNVGFFKMIDCCIDAMFAKWNPEDPVDSQVLLFLAELNQKQKEANNDNNEDDVSSEIEIKQVKDEL